MGAIMAEANVAAGVRPATSSSSAQRSSSASGSARINAVRPPSPVGTNLAFSQALIPPQPSGDVSLQNQPITLKAGSGMLSKDVQFLLAETRMQEEQASVPAPSSIGRAIDSYSQTQTRVRETIGAFRVLASKARNTDIETAA